MKAPALLSARNVLLFSLVAEGATGLAVILAPGLVAQLLFGTEVAGAGVAYGFLAALYLVWLGVAHRPAGILLWPAIVEHTLVTLLLATRLRVARPATAGA